LVLTGFQIGLMIQGKKGFDKSLVLANGAKPKQGVRAN